MSGTFSSKMTLPVFGIIIFSQGQIESYREQKQMIQKVLNRKIGIVKPASGTE
jgi:hypothetical protein